MENVAKCGRCGSDRVIPNVDLLTAHGEYGPGELEASVDEDPVALLFRRRVASALKAVICGACGHAEVYVEEPDALYQGYLGAKAKLQVAADRLGAATVQRGMPSLPDSASDACLRCGAAIPGDDSVCPSCGWTYKEREPA